MAGIIEFISLSCLIYRKCFIPLFDIFIHKDNDIKYDK